MSSLEHAVAATQGARDYQEDAALFRLTPALVAAEAGQSCDQESGLAVLADGMGGHAGGALASRMVCDAFADASTGTYADSAELLMHALESANAAVAGKVVENPLLNGMGSTVVGVHFGPDGLAWVSVGDSILYLYRRGELAILNKDHSLAPELDRLVAEGRLTEEEARHDPRRHMLRSAVTGDEIDLIDVSEHPLALQPDDYVILASDGIATLDKEEVARVVQGYAKDGAKAIADALIRAIEAVREPYQDNATVLVVRRLAE